MYKLSLFSAPSAPPGRILLNESSPISLSIHWGPVPCVHHHGRITGYVLMYRRKSQENFQIKNVTGDIREFEITGLKPSTEYEVKVAAVTVVGVGPYVNGSFNTSGL